MTIDESTCRALSGPHLEPVEVLQVCLPRWTEVQAVEVLLDRLERRSTTGVCFPNMSMLSVCSAEFRNLVRRRMFVLNDGLGLDLAARMRGRPFPADLNFTDLCEPFLDAVAPGTTLYLLGTRPDVVASAAEHMAKRWPHVSLVGHHHGFLDAESEAHVIDELHRLRPNLIFVGMGNPLQVEIIDRHLDDPTLSGTMWFAVGGLLDRCGGELKRAPEWMLRARLEFLHIVIQQPHKFRRYVRGITQFVWRVLWAQARGQHELPEGLTR